MAGTSYDEGLLSTGPSPWRGWFQDRRSFAGTSDGNDGFNRR